MTEELEDLILDYRNTDWESLLKGNAGDYHFKELKPHLDFIKNFFDKILNDPYFESLHQYYENEYWDDSFKGYLEQFKEIKEEIKKYPDGGQKRGDIVQRVRSFRQDILRGLKDLYNILKLQNELHPDHQKKDHQEKVVSKYKQTTKEIEQELKKIQQFRSQYAEQTVRDESTRYGDFFKKEAESNNKRSIKYMFCFVGISVASIGVAYKYLKFDQSIQANGFVELLIKGDVINKVFIVSVVFIIISVIKKEYLALRHQFALNTHRHNALSSHKEILSSIKKTASGSDKEISNAILLELTKSMFSPQDTGFIKESKNPSTDSKIVEISRSVLGGSKN